LAEARVFHCWTKRTEDVAAPTPTPADLVAEVHAEYLEANRKWIDCWTAVRRYYATHGNPQGFKRVGDCVFQQLTMDPQLTEIARRENHARVVRDAKLKAWSDLKLKLSTNDAVHVAGERVQSWP
jgi:hypothetical protein